MKFLPGRSEVVMRHLFERNVRTTPNKECIRFEDGERWTYGEALEEAYKAANVLAEVGIERGANVLVFLPNSQEWIRSWWGATFLGAVIVPVNTAYKGEILRHICKDSRAEHIITKTDLAEHLKGLGLDLNIVNAGTLAEGSSEAPKLETPIEPWDIHAILYTSGTTGPSKGVISSYFHTYRCCSGFLGRVTREDTFLADHPLFHMSGMINAFALWTVNGRVALRSVFSGSRYWEVIRESGATCSVMLGTIPAFLEKTPRQPNDADNPLRLTYCAPMVSDPAAFKARFDIEELLTGWGMTETGPVIVGRGVAQNPKNCGAARLGVQLRVVDDHDIPVPTGEKGELIVRTDLPWELNSGYHGRPEETAHAWRNGWFHTGDLFVCDEEGNYYFVDRKKDAIRRRGENISSFEVEREVMAHPDVVEAACVATPGEYGEDEVKVFVIPRKGCAFDPADMIKYLIPRMAYFMVPRFVEVVDAFPKTATLRVRKSELQARGNGPATWDREASGIEVKRTS